MNAFAGAAARAGRAGRGLVPSGQLLTPEVWARRHRGIVWLLWLHVAGVAVFARLRGTSLAHAVAEVAPMAVFALAAALPALGRRARSAAAVLIHLSGGVVEAHFHFFVIIGVITLYQDWLPFGLASATSSSTTPSSGCWSRPPCSTTAPPCAPRGRGPWSTAPLLPACALDDAVRIVERLLLVTPLVTCSVGLACWDFQEDATELVERADQALYAAKAEGRNRYVLAS
jgi:diguanylate cyclase with GGDEF domain